MIMATKKLDVWVVESDTVYREVPFTVVADWLQQGRLLGEDKVRLSGQEQWHAVSAVGAFKPYLPRPEPVQADDRAEALEPVELGLQWNRPRDEEDEDVDMIPLIDISLVLLIFFMMTASVTSGILSPIDTPPAKHQLAAISEGMWWVGVDSKSRAGAVERDADGQPLPWLSFGRDTEETLAPTTDRQKLISEIIDALGAEAGEARVRLRADRSLPIETIKGVTLDLQDIEARLNRGREASARLSVVITGEVSEPAP
jgi:biopolymer transport protein ExbD